MFSDAAASPPSIAEAIETEDAWAREGADGREERLRDDFFSSTIGLLLLLSPPCLSLSPLCAATAEIPAPGESGARSQEHEISNEERERSPYHDCLMNEKRTQVEEKKKGVKLLGVEGDQKKKKKKNSLSLSVFSLSSRHHNFSLSLSKRKKRGPVTSFTFRFALSSLLAVEIP